MFPGHSSCPTTTNVPRTFLMSHFNSRCWDLPADLFPTPIHTTLKTISLAVLFHLNYRSIPSHPCFHYYLMYFLYPNSCLDICWTSSYSIGLPRVEALLRSGELLVQKTSEEDHVPGISCRIFTVSLNTL
ncbi:unnamed protein product, partial [Timema podura]|nr:unnamed protein product [Timema podura]